jgi:hypothetical protein
VLVVGTPHFAAVSRLAHPRRCQLFMRKAVIGNGGMSGFFELLTLYHSDDV